MLSLLVLIAISVAATVTVHTTLPIDVAVDERAAGRSYGPSTMQFDDLSAGSHTITVSRGGTPTTLPITLATDEHLHLYVSADDISVSAAPAADTDAAPPVVELRSADGARFQVRIDGGPAQVLGPEAPLRLEGLSTDEHTVEIARADGLVVWVRGRVLLQAGDELMIQVAEGRMVEVFGRAGAWRSGP